MTNDNDRCPCLSPTTPCGQHTVARHAWREALGLNGTTGVDARRQRVLDEEHEAAAARRFRERYN